MVVSAKREKLGWWDAEVPAVAYLGNESLWLPFPRELLVPDTSPLGDLGKIDTQQMNRPNI